MHSQVQQKPFKEAFAKRLEKNTKNNDDVSY